MNLPRRSLREWFDRFVDLAPDEREHRIDQEIDDPDVRARLRALIAADEAPTRPIAAAAPERLTEALDAVTPAVLSKGTHFAGYAIDRWLADGGSASVYRAHRSLDGVTQTVALKLLRRGLGAAEARLQFDRERRALAQLDHPGIARLIDGGVTDDGQGYLVLEYVDGQSITEYAAAHSLSLRARLRLMIEAAEAVAAAHRALIVHRDIKPGNVMVTPEGRVKLLDFGIAKLLGEDDLTRTAFRVFTPAYAAPEQREGAAITTATDVFSLGALLGELLTGRRLADGDTTRPSERIDDKATPGVLPEPPSRLRRSLRGDLDNILLKATAHEPKRRYESAIAFADDLERALDGRPVAAHPPSRAYRAAKFVRRNRAAVVVGMVASLAVLAALAMALYQRNEALAQSRRAFTEARNARAAQDFLVAAFKSTEPGTATSSHQTMLDFTEKAAATLSRDASLDPEVRAELQATLGSVLGNQGNNEEAMRMLEDAVARAERERLPAATLARMRAKLAEVATTMGNYPRSLQALREYETDNDALDLSDRVPLLTQLAAAYSQVPDDARSTRFATEADALCAHQCNADQQLTVLEQLANVHATFNRNAEAEAVYRRALPIAEQRHGAQSVEVASLWNGLGRALRRQGKLDDALAAVNRALAIDAAILPPTHLRRSIHLNNLGMVEIERNDLAASEAAFAEVVRISKALLPADNPSLVMDLQNLAMVKFRRGELAGAEAALRDALELSEKSTGAHSLQAAMIRGSHAHAQAMRGEWSNTRASMRQALDDLRAAGAGGSTQLVSNLIRESQQRQWRAGEGDPLIPLTEADAVLKSLGGNVSPAESEKVAIQRAAVLLDRGDDAEARKLADALRTGAVVRGQASAASIEWHLLQGQLAAHSGDSATARHELDEADRALTMQSTPYPYLLRRRMQLADALR